ncbi:MAG: hypothetical protein ABIH63_03820 [archaeon]
MFKGHRIERKVEMQLFLDLIRCFDDSRIILTNHAFFRLSDEQRKVFKEEVIKNVILRDKPIFVGRQYNQCYAVFYNYGKDVLKIILDVQPDRIYIVTFYFIEYDKIPRL